MVMAPRSELLPDELPRLPRVRSSPPECGRLPYLKELWELRVDDVTHGD
jgi:hypothetical protein